MSDDKTNVVELPVEAADSSVLVADTAPSERPRKQKSPGQMSYSDLRKRVRELESALAAAKDTHSDARVEKLQAENDQLLARLAAYDRAESELSRAAEEHLKRTYAQFEARAVAIRHRFPDFDKSLEGLHKFLRTELIHTILEWENAPFTLYALAKNPAFSEHLKGLPLGLALERTFRFVLEAEQKLLSENVAATYARVAGNRR